MEDNFWKRKIKEERKAEHTEEEMSGRQTEENQPKGRCEGGHQQLTILNQPNQHTSSSRSVDTDKDMICHGEPHAGTTDAVTKYKEKIESITIDRKIVTGITVNGRSLMELQKIRQCNKEELSSPSKKKKLGRKKIKQQTTPSVNKPGDILKYIEKKKAVVKQDDDHVEERQRQGDDGNEER